MNIDWMPYLPEFKTIAIAIGVALLLWLIAHLLTRILARFTRPFLFPRLLLEQTRAPIHLILPLLGMQTVWTAAPEELLWMGGLRHITLLLIIGAGIAYLLEFILISISRTRRDGRGHGLLTTLVVFALTGTIFAPLVSSPILHLEGWIELAGTAGLGALGGAISGLIFWVLAPERA